MTGGRGKERKEGKESERRGTIISKAEETKKIRKRRRKRKAKGK